MNLIASEINDVIERRIYAEGVFHQRFLKDKMVSDLHILESIQFLKKNKIDFNFVNVLEFEGFSNIQPEVRRWAKSTFKRKGNAIADAIIVEKLPQKITANFYLSVDGPILPTKIFQKREDAFHWAKEQLLINPLLIDG